MAQSKKYSTVKVNSELKSQIELAKGNQSFNEYFTSIISKDTSLSPDIIFSAITSAPVKSDPGTIVGASQGEEIYNVYVRTLNWIKDTKRKLPSQGDEENITPGIREEAFNLDPLLNGTISQYTKNILFTKWNLVTEDNKKYAEMIKEQKEFLERIEAIPKIKEEFDAYRFIHGKMYFRKDRDDLGHIQKLQALEPSCMWTLEDPWDSTIRAYHQRINVKTGWDTNYTLTTESNSWFIPGGKKYIEASNYEEPGAKELWEEYRKKYNISQTVGLRVGNADDIMALHLNKIDSPAPIDGALLSIWLKRTVLANMANVIYAIQNPFMHLKKGIMYEVTDKNGNKIPQSSAPSKPPANMATTDPEMYNALLALHTAFNTALDTDLKNLQRYRAESGMFASGPDTTLTMLESASTLAPTFISTILNALDEDISNSVAFPRALVKASGAELATSSTIKSMFNNSMGGSKLAIENMVLHQLLYDEFKDRKWKYSIEDMEGNVTDSGEYTMDDTGLRFELGEGDNKDELVQAQTELVVWQGLQIAKAVGAGKADLQAVLDEKGMGYYELDNYDSNSNSLPQNDMGQETTAEPSSNAEGVSINKPELPKPSLPSDVKKTTVGEIIASTVKPEKANGEDTKLEKELLSIFKELEEEVRGLVK